MSLSKTTIVVVLLAGDQDTINSLDPLLREIQCGVNNWQAANRPDVFCCYHRWMQEERQVQTWHYQISDCTLSFQQDGSGHLDLRNYPPRGAGRLHGNVNDQVRQFLRTIRPGLHSDGPIRLIIGAHGKPSLGIDPDRLLRFLWQLFLSEFNSELDQLTWQQRLELIRSRILQTGPPFGGITSNRTSNAPDLTLDQAKEALDLLPVDRLKTLIMHTCNLSGIETCAALSTVPHHIACESELFPPAMKLGYWFPVLGDPNANETTITAACFRNIQYDKPNAQGYFSSHCTIEITALLRKLNELGDVLYRFITSTGGDRIRATITEGWDGCHTSPFTVDLGHFCKSLEDSGAITPKSLLEEVICLVKQLQVVPAVMTLNSPPDRFKNYIGINVFFPKTKETARGYTSNNLPRLMQTLAVGWCKFLDEWLK